jgi:DNA end-binding protein Ku
MGTGTNKAAWTLAANEHVKALVAQSETSTFEPEKFEDHYEAALTKLIDQKRTGKPIAAKARPKGENVVDLMDALKRSIANDRGAESTKGKKPRKAAAGQKEMLLPISGKRASKAEAKKDKPAASRARKRTWPEISQRDE